MITSCPVQGPLHGRFERRQRIWTVEAKTVRTAWLALTVRTAQELLNIRERTGKLVHL